MWTKRLAITAALSSVAATAALAGQSAPEGVRALKVEYADGRTTHTPMGTSGRVSWTGAFPRVAGADTSREGLQLQALQFEEAVAGPKLVVTIALLYGSPMRKRVKVTTVTVADERAVRVDELEAFGVRPVTLSLVPLPPADLLLPSVTNPSTYLDATAETDSGDVPAYRLVVRNRSSQPVMMLAFETYRGNVKNGGGRHRGPGHTPLIAAGETHTVRIGATAAAGREGSSPEWSKLDRFVITAVVWGDGLVEGNPKPAADERAMDAGTAQQLERVVALLRAAAHAPSPQGVVALREQIGALPVTVPPQESAALAAIGMQNAKNAILNDLDEFSRTQGASDAAAYAAWLAASIGKFEGWRQRIVAPR
jgi:hypothetical protein